MRRAAVLSFSIATAALPPSAGASSVQELAWLQGCWGMVSGERTVEEQWMGPRGGIMLGASRTVQGGRLVEHEFVAIREDGDRLLYEARPSGQAPATFPARVLTSRSVVFENLQHDFPQRIGYSREGDRLLAWIEGPRNGQTRRIEFTYQRASCESK
jgi:hypothetical protein